MSHGSCELLLSDAILQPLHLDEVIQQTHRHLGLWGGGEPRAGLSVLETALGVLDCGEEWKGMNIGVSVVARME